MAGRVRQPIDVGALENWISKNVREIEVPLDVKQVGLVLDPSTRLQNTMLTSPPATHSSVSANPTRHTN